jgi:tetratricopeptide (TPR) repeat protein
LLSAISGARITGTPIALAQSMTVQELEEIVLRNTADISELRRRQSEVESKEQRAAAAIGELRRRAENFLLAFDRDRYKSTDQRLTAHALATEALIFDRLGYETGFAGSRFLLGVAALLEGRNQAALDYFDEFIRGAGPEAVNLQDAYYLSAMICYNRREFNQAIEFYEWAFRRSPKERRDWQSKIYVGELLYFLRKPKEEIERAFFDVEEGLKADHKVEGRNFLLATLYLKLGNCYTATLLDPKEANPMRNNRVAIRYFKQARQHCPRLVGSDSLLPAVIDYSLAQSLLLENSVDMDLAETPSELIADVFCRLRRIVLNKREEIILAQSYLMLGTCAFSSGHLSKDVGEIYLEHARHQTLSVPTDVCFYSCVTKELLSRDEFVRQIDHFASELEREQARR